MWCIRVSHKIDVFLNCATLQNYLLNTYARGIRAAGFVLQPVRFPIPCPQDTVAAAVRWFCCVSAVL